MNHPTSRPRRFDEAVMRAAISELAKHLNRWGATLDWPKLLWPFRMERSGYQIAKKLELHNAVDVDDELVEILADYEFNISNAHRAAVLEWAKKEAIQPCLQIGARVISENGLWAETGTIVSIDIERAAYLIIPDNERDLFAGGGGYVVNYENVSDEEVVDTNIPSSANPPSPAPEHMSNVSAAAGDVL